MSFLRPFFCAVALCVTFFNCAAVVKADELRPGYLELTEQDPNQWRLGWKQPVTKPPKGRLPVPIIPEICKFSVDPQAGLAGGAVIGTAMMRCDAPLEGQPIAMPGMLGQSDMLVRVAPLAGPVQALRLTSSEPQVEIAAKPDNSQVLQTYFVIGVEHILAGWDHLLFVIALVLLVRRPKAVIGAATAFTLSHSITLAAASLGYVGLPQRPVEALIALSIMFLALEIVRVPEGEPTLARRYPWVVAFLFGLLHGFGFAGALSAIGLPEGEVVSALLAFNIGVEAGQLLVIAVVLAALALFVKLATRWSAPTIKFATYAIGITGAYWLVDRTIG